MKVVIKTCFRRHIHVICLLVFCTLSLIVFDVLVVLIEVNCDILYCLHFAALENQQHAC